MEDEKPKHPGGRPATGVTPKRNIRIGQTWDDAAEIAAETGETVTAYVQRAIEAANAKHRKQRERLSKAAGVDDKTTERWKLGK